MLQEYNDPNLSLDSGIGHTLEQRGLIAVEMRLQIEGKSLADFPPMPCATVSADSTPRMIAEELMHDCLKQRAL